MLKVKFFGHCAKRMAAQHRFSYDLIWEFTMTLYASDIVSSYVAYQNNIKASYSDMILNSMQKKKCFQARFGIEGQVLWSLC